MNKHILAISAKMETEKIRSQKKSFLSILCLSFLLASCAVTHKRGNDPDEQLSIYLQNKATLEKEIAQIKAQNPDLFGELTLKWSVNSKGEVVGAQIINDSVQNLELNLTLLEHLKSIAFKKTPTFMTSTVEYTYKFVR